ncbi:hypothetical protein JF634_06435 [Simonsiella muelleri]|uniref:Uncharacterized protein n=1 Tax=Simonsiella muelleri ATCC 29453 TaxID=641147 RepID=V9H845_9NEIS|nr:hypothetical protein [Simonsiella muelleri]EFG30628.1 hypothetical protein HMPREF9021_01598 [Simonsiella muelleri ATCC 29453]UBQ52871.1 hypothetical protein JF634_06435 [Simonsiella muelleri]
MRIHCKECSHSEEPTAEFFVKVIGGAMPIGGFWAWITYFLQERILHLQFVQQWWLVECRYWLLKMKLLNCLQKNILAPSVVVGIGI